MFQPFSRKQHGIFFRLSAFLTVLAFSANLIVLPSKTYAQSALNLPRPGVIVTPTPSFIPPVMKGIKIFPDNPLRFDFIIDTGQSNLTQDKLKAESAKLIKYFLATLTVPDDDLWVNLSPYEKDRIIADQFGQTEMGRDLLSQDYVLKQLTASLLYPEKDLGKKFWDKVYAKVRQLYGTTKLPVNTFNKVWIVPDKAIIYESGDTAFIVKSHLKVMLESDYLSLKENMGEIKVKKLKQEDVQQINDVSSAIIKEVILPEIEKEVNEGKIFVSLRQVYNSMILATWFKRTLRESFLSKIYVGENKIAGVDVEDKQVKEKIYQQYLETFKKGVYNYIKEDYDPATQRIIPRKYFSGGMEFTAKAVDKALLVEPKSAQETEAEVVKTTDGKLQTVSAVLDPVKNLDRLRRILNVLAQSDQVPQVPQGASEDVILEFVLNHLQAQGLIKEVRDDSTDVKVFVIKDEVKESELGKAVQRWVMEPRGGVRAINFKGTDGAWKIVSFESDIDQQIDLEREEVKERKAGNHWIVAHNNARQKLSGGDQQIDQEGARQQYEVARKDKVGASVFQSDKVMASEIVVIKRRKLLDQFRSMLGSVPKTQRDAIAHEFNFSESNGKESLNHAYDFGLRGFFNRYYHNYDAFEEAYHESTRSQVTALFQLAALDLALGGMTPASFSEKREISDLRKVLQNSKIGIILEMLFVLYPKATLPMVNVEIGFDDRMIYEKLFEASLNFRSTDEFIQYLDRRIFGENAGLSQEDWVDILISDSSKRNLWLQSVFDIVALPLEGAYSRLNAFFVKSAEQRSAVLDMPRMFDVFSRAVKRTLETRPESSSIGMGKGQEDWRAKFDSNSRQDLLHGINTGFYVDATGTLVENDGSLPSFSHVFWYSRLGIVLDALNELKLGLDLDVVHERLFEMGRGYATYDDFINALERRVFGEDALLSTSDWRGDLSNDPVKRENWLRVFLNMAVSSESEERRSDIENKFQALTAPAAFWPVIIEQAANPKTLREGFSGRSSPWASNNLRINNGFWALGPEKALGLVSRGIRGALEKSLLEEGFAAPDHEQLMKRGFLYLPLSTSELPYGGVGWSNGILVFFTKDRLSVATADELRDFKARYGSEWKIGWTDKDEVVVKNSASWDALKYLFLSKEVFVKNFDKLTALNLLGRVIVIDSMNGDTIEYFRGDNQKARSTLKRDLLAEFVDGTERWQIASRLVVTEVFKNEYRHQLVDGESREQRILEATRSVEEFLPEEIADTLHEDLDIVLDVLIDSKSYSVTNTRINYNGQRSVMLRARTGEMSQFSWEDISRELSSAERKQYEEAKNEYARHRALMKTVEVYPGSRIGRYDMQEGRGLEFMKDVLNKNSSADSVMLGEVSSPVSNPNTLLSKLKLLYPNIETELPDNDKYWQETALDFEQRKAGDSQPLWFFDEVLSGVDKDSPILEIATGSGRALVEIINMGYHNVLGTDISGKVLGEAEKKGIPKDRLRRLNIKTERVENKYSVVLASDVLLYLTPEELHDVMININYMLKEGGRLAIRWAAGNNEIIVKDKGGARWVFHASEEFLRQMLPLFGFEIMDVQKKKEPIYGGSAFVDYWYVIAKKNRNLSVPFLEGQLSKALDTRINQIVERKHSHIFSVTNFMKDFIANDFESLLASFKDIQVDREQYRVIIEELYGRYLRLSPGAKKALEVATILYDIGATKEGRDWIHNQNGIHEDRTILKELGLDTEFIKEVETVVLHHGAYANIGTDYLPKDFQRLSEEQKDMLLLVSIFDMSGRAEGNRATPEKIRELLDLRVRGLDMFMEEQNLYQYRLGGFLSPVLFTSLEERKRNFQSIFGILKESEYLTGSFIENWNNLIRCYAFAIFRSLGELSPEQFVKLIVSINRLVDEYRLDHEITDVIVDTDIDFMGLFPHSKKAPYVNSLLRVIQDGYMPLDINIQDRILHVTIKLGDTTSASSGVDLSMTGDSQGDLRREISKMIDMLEPALSDSNSSNRVSAENYKKLYLKLPEISRKLAVEYRKLATSYGHEPGTIEVWGVGSRFRGAPLAPENQRGDRWRPDTDVDLILITDRSDNNFGLSEQEYQREIGKILIGLVRDFNLPVRIGKAYTNGLNNEFPDYDDRQQELVYLDIQAMGKALIEESRGGWVDVGYDRKFLSQGGGGLLLAKETAGSSPLPSDNAKRDVKKNPGGIDFNPNMLDIEKQGQGIDFNVPVDLQTIQTIQIDGFSPVIFQIIPTNLPMLMGTKKAEDTMQVSSIR